MLLSLVLLAAATAAPPDVEIRRTIQLQAEAWSRGDIQAFMSAYENSPETTMIGKSVVKGYQAILQGYQKRYPGKDGMGQLRFDELEVRLLSPNSAITTGRFHVHRTAQNGGDASGRFTLVLRKTKAGWRILHDHTTSG